MQSNQVCARYRYLTTFPSSSELGKREEEEKKKNIGAGEMRSLQVVVLEDQNSVFIFLSLKWGLLMTP